LAAIRSSRSSRPIAATSWTPTGRPSESSARRSGKTENGKVLTLDVKAGDRVLFGEYAGTEIKLDGEEP
jgi:Chaperonin 10 Kd subunit